MIEAKNIERRHSHHGHFHLRAGSVIDHLKIKVKRKKLLKHDPSALSDGALNQDININNNNNSNKRLNQEHAESLHEVSLTSSDSHSNIQSTILQKNTSFDENDIENSML
jgi:hypothetical protein